MLLLDQHVLVLDCQTTGSSPAQGGILELGWAVASAAEESFAVTSRVIGQTNGVPKRIEYLTGIGANELIGATELGGVEEELSKDIQRVFQNALIPTVIHYARFEMPFLREVFSLSERFEPFCTYEIARRLFPDLPSRSIRAVAGYLGHPIDEVKRATHHVAATCFIWRKLVCALAEQGVTSLGSLREFLEAPPPKRKGPKRYALAKQVRLTLPDAPGVYRLKATGGRILYVGKATSLRDRVNSYFRGQKTKGSRLNELVSQVTDIEVTACGSPLEAALLETDLIKELSPPYNRALKMGGRELFVTDRQLNRLGEFTPGTWGPFTSPIQHLQWQLLFDHRNSPELAELLTEFSELLTPETVSQGFDLVEAEVGGLFSRKAPCLRRVLSWGFVGRVKRARERLRQKAIASETSELEEQLEDQQQETAVSEEQITPWEPEDFARFVRSVAGGIAFRIFRGRWIRRLMNAQIDWELEGKAYQLTVRNGQVGRHDLEVTGLEGAGLQGACLDLKTYDRISVLRTELLRILQQGGKVRLRIQDRPPLTTEDLQRLMFPEYFDEKDSPRCP